MSKTGKIACIGDKDSILAFKAIGAQVFNAQSPQNAIEILHTLCNGEYAVVFITEEIAVGISDTLAKLKARPYPAIIPIPGSNGSNGFGLDGIKKDVEKAVGVDILFNND